MKLLNKNSIIVVLILTFCIVFNAKSQDFHLSQYSAAPLYLNPALAGQFDGTYRVHAQYRTQWGSVSSKPFNSAAISFDMPYKNFAFGAQILNNRAGAGNYNALGIAINGAYNFAISKNGFHKISLGVQGGIIQKSVDFNNLYFENQYTIAGGGTFDQSLPTGETFGANSFMVPDVNVGILYYFGKDQSRFNPFIGYSLFHITQPTETFYNVDNKLPMRQVVHGGVKINVSERVQLLPKGLFMQQQNDQELIYGLIIHYQLKKAGAILIFGPSFRSNDAFIIEGGLKLGNYEGRISYDYNTSSLSNYSDGKGGFEISLTYIPKIFNPTPIKNCPRI